MEDTNCTNPAPRSSRRRFLFLGTAPVAALAVHRVALASASEPAPHPDAEVIALGQRWREARRASLAAFSRAMDIEDYLDPPERPEPLREKGRDSFILGVGLGQVAVEGVRYYSKAQVEELRSTPRTRQDLSRSNTLPCGGIGVGRVPCPVAQARADEIVVAFDAWTAERKAGRDACGLTAAEAELGLLATAEEDLRSRLVGLRARTLEGLRAKAEIVGDLQESTAWIERRIALADAEEAALFSIARDLLRMGGSA